VKPIAIQDANILIDLVKTGLFDYCLALKYQFMTTDIILDELYPEQALLIQPHILSGKFEVIAITATELIEIQVMSIENANLSEQDWSAVYYAQKRNALLLTGDKRMRAIAAAKSILFAGILWLLDELVAHDILSVTEACFFLKKLRAVNKWLPQDECELRIKSWCK
jgi:hypothetical protein